MHKESLFKGFFKFGGIKVIKRHTKTMLLNFRNRALEIWLKRCNIHVIAFAETTASQANGEMSPLSFQI